MNKKSCLTRATRFHAQKPFQKNLACEHCISCLSQKHELVLHNDRLQEKKKSHNCEFCGANFATNQERVSHTRAVHEKLKPHKCSL